MVIRQIIERLDPSASIPPPGKIESFGSGLKRWRRHRGFSQLDLAGEAGISSRHLSFLETGRSNPSQTMVLRLAEALDLSLRHRNRLLVSAGYAPQHRERALDHPDMERVRKIVDQILERHEPYPAYAMNGAWCVESSNRVHRAMLARLTGSDAETNILKLFFDPELLRPHVVDWEHTAAVVLRRALIQLEARPHDELREILTQVISMPGVRGLIDESTPAADDLELVIPIRLRIGQDELSLLTTILQFGAPIDVTLDELVVECFFPADGQTEQWFSAFAAELE